MEWGYTRGFLMPFFLFIVGVALGLAYKRVPNRVVATRKAILRALKLCLLGLVLQECLTSSISVNCELTTPNKHHCKEFPVNQTTEPAIDSSFDHSLLCLTNPVKEEEHFPSEKAG
ncbi:uncharacterized protein LOC120282113 [Dioscorea cayenensis subsp. rotundata]|uniref:Uncharacterized protein LOC120282113 n=1 Tax=Dioscorea cayennensis subsp. rotundata TaxID=55577 RepID=A0AB40CXP2_DIOCR|nr:uncharacterized protein LOC120282113 [Dioscorea cayenensis subsp. rotundata]XP_039144797.1 uncharacterized protein LOC120282113 [Dioscorea cayenensis subsp. rotundata]